MNAAILIAVVSAGNTSVYASSRILFALAKNGQAPKIFATTWKGNGVPLPAMCVSVLIGFVAFFGAIFGQGVVFTWLYNLYVSHLCLYVFNIQVLAVFTPKAILFCSKHLLIIF